MNANREWTPMNANEETPLRPALVNRNSRPLASIRGLIPPRQDQSRNRDLDPQFVWRGKDDADWSALVVPAPPLYIQEKVHPKVLIDDLLRQSKARAQARATEFYQHDANWTNRMILGDSLQLMASLAQREGLRGKVQCIYLDPPYGIKFNSNFQWATTSRDVKDGNPDHITREPEQVKAFRDTWRDAIHSYLTYLQATPRLRLGLFTWPSIAALHRTNRASSLEKSAITEERRPERPLR